MRIGINGAQFIEWTGGLDFVALVTRCANTIPGAQLHLIIPTKGPRKAALDTKRKLAATIKKLTTRKKQVSYAPSREQIIEAFASIDNSIEIHEIDIGVTTLSQTVKKLGLDVLLPCSRPLPPRFPIPWIGYLYDYQHKYYPEFFTQKELEVRENDFSHMLSTASTILVNAKSVVSDTAKFHPDAQARLFAMPFSASPKQHWLENRPSCQQKYNIDSPYFITCNQFWLHKNHRTLFEAFKIFTEQTPNIHLVCTGATADYRNPDYFTSLQQYIKENGLESKIHILGMIPKIDQIDLIRESIALIQPTLFEGGPGGGSAYDAISVGKRCIVSDIQVNREIEDDNTDYFSAKDPISLSRAMYTAQKSDIGRFIDNAKLIQRGAERIKNCGSLITEAIKHATRG